MVLALSMVKAFHLHNCGNQVAFKGRGIRWGTHDQARILCNSLIVNIFMGRGAPQESGIQDARLVLAREYYWGRRVGSQTLREGKQLDQVQRRRSPRIRLQVPVFLRGADASGAEFVELTKTLNIGATGACITSSHILRIEQIVHLTVPAPTPTSSSLVPIETPPIAARVLRQEVAGETRLFGLEFLRPLE
jgi:hypothetical protein